MKLDTSVSKNLLPESHNSKRHSSSTEDNVLAVCFRSHFEEDDNEMVLNSEMAINDVEDPLYAPNCLWHLYSKEPD